MVFGNNALQVVFWFVGVEAIESIRNQLRCNRMKKKLNPISTNLLHVKGNPSPYVQKVQSMKLHKMVEVLQNSSKLFLLRKERKVSRIK